MASPDLVANEPATVIAFLTAYVQALEDLGDADEALASLELIEASDLAVDLDVAADWPEALQAFAPFDGGFGSVDDDGGLGELDAYLVGANGEEPNLESIIAQHTLNIAQAWSQLSPNPVTGLAGSPGLTEITVGLPLADAAVTPVSVAQDAGYFEDAGFASVEVMDVEQPLLGVLQGELDFGVLDATDAADGVAQGLPLAARAGHRNYAADGTYGGDLLATSADFLGEEGSTVSAFLIAYIRALRDLAGTTGGAFRPIRPMPWPPSRRLSR
jgi:ABC-type nitrate/sulfonate/bicarbonate transport system substrate-binding protein